MAQWQTNTRAYLMGRHPIPITHEVHTETAASAFLFYNYIQGTRPRNFEWTASTQKLSQKPNPFY